MPLEPLFEESDLGKEVFSRLQQVYKIAGDGRRSDGMKDAFFIVRRPDFSSVEKVKQSAELFFGELAALAEEQNKNELAENLKQKPELRLLEGAAPKHPKADREKSGLMKAVSQIGPTVTEELIAKDPFAKLLQRAFYFLACDGFLRDFVLWPMLAEHSQLDDPFQHYFVLWRHGVKFRIFGESQIDLYLPRNI